MKNEAHFTVSVRFDEAAMEHEAKRRGRSLESAVREVLGDIECRLFDSVRHRDGVERVGVGLVELW
jgi:hypothetical protein